MERTTITNTVDAGLCSGCGICAGACPGSCIAWEKRSGMYLPRIDESLCTQCGLCAGVCPGLGHRYAPAADDLAAITGPVLESYNAWSRDEALRHISASGGVVTTLVQALLEQGRYDSVFCLDTYDYREQLHTRRFGAGELRSDGGNAPKSRYLPVSHEEAVRYLLSHRRERIILIGTSCALRGLSAVIGQRKLDRENYLLIGLFCDKVFNYNMIPFLQDRFCGGTPLTALHFKNKESGGWPGDMKLFPKDRDSFFVPMEERARAKAYFMPERCLYCVDKLNVTADISLGDNYTGIDSSKKGSNSVILRTARGQDAWDLAQERLESVPVDIARIQAAQYLDGRLNNLYFGDLKAAECRAGDLNVGVPRKQDCTEFTGAWKHALRQLRAGGCYERDPRMLEKQMLRDARKPSFVISFLRRALGFMKRSILGR